jgi:hypothetical protein
MYCSSGTAYPWHAAAFLHFKSELYKYAALFASLFYVAGITMVFTRGLPAQLVLCCQLD